MDLKIGLLIRNRVTLQDVLTYRKKLKGIKKMAHPSDGNSSAFAFTNVKMAASRKKRELYENLFYLLQTNPIYLAKLIFAIPHSQTTKFVETVVLTLYNYGSNHRDEYLLLKVGRRSPIFNFCFIYHVARIQASDCNWVWIYFSCSKRRFKRKYNARWRRSAISFAGTRWSSRWWSDITGMQADRTVCGRCSNHSYLRYFIPLALSLSRN